MWQIHLFWVPNFKKLVFEWVIFSWKISICMYTLKFCDHGKAAHPYLRAQATTKTNIQVHELLVFELPPPPPPRASINMSWDKVKLTGDLFYERGITSSPYTHGMV